MGSKEYTFLQSLQLRRDLLPPSKVQLLREHAYRGVQSFIKRSVKDHFAGDIIKQYGYERLGLPIDTAIGDISLQINIDFKSFRVWLKQTYQ